LRVPNLDVPTAAGNLLSIGAPRHRKDPEIVRSQDLNQQKQRGKNRKKLTRPSARSTSTHESAGEQMKKRRINLQFRMPGHRALKNVHFAIFYIYIIFEHQRRSPSKRKTYVFESFTFLFFEDMLI